MVVAHQCQQCMLSSVLTLLRLPATIVAETSLHSRPMAPFALPHWHMLIAPVPNFARHITSKRGQSLHSNRSQAYYSRHLHHFLRSGHNAPGTPQKGIYRNCPGHRRHSASCSKPVAGSHGLRGAEWFHNGGSSLEHRLEGVSCSPTGICTHWRGRPADNVCRH